LNSIVAQTFTDWECILVDDGSPDNSGEICDEYAQKDKRFRVFHQENQGVSAARNKGLDEAKGEWITFVDSDDWIESETYNVALFAAKLHNADTVLWHYQINDENRPVEGFIDSEREFIISKQEVLPLCRNACWCILISKEIVNANHIRFPQKISMGEDRHFVYCCYACANKIWVLPYLFYHYFENPDSACRSKYTIKKIDDDAKSITMTESFIRERGNEQFDASILNVKIEIKSQYYHLLDRPNFAKWRSTFPELNKSLLFTRKKGVILYWMAVLHLDYLAELIFKLKKE
jgi:glycosyltransferase involved in cell wall biosynthesis